MKRTSFLMALTMACIIWMSVDNNGYVTKEYVVQQGDTIWSIVSNESDISGDIREVVFDTYRLNNINQNENIYPGQAILIPVRE